VDNRKRDIGVWSSDAGFRSAVVIGSDMSRVLAQRRLKSLQKEMPFYRAIFLVDLKGKVVASSLEKEEERNLPVKGALKEALSGRSALGRAFLDVDNNSPVLPFSNPVARKSALGEGEVVGAVFARVDLGGFAKKVLGNVKVAENGHAFLMDQEGFLLYHPDNSLVLKTNYADFDFGRHMLDQKNGFLEYVWQGSSKLASIAEIKELGWIVGAGAEKLDLLADAREVGLIGGCLALVMLLVAAVIIYWVAGSVIKPIKGITGYLGSGALEVASTANQVAGTSHLLAEGASQQAASLEETSASLAQMASMTEQNTQSARHADKLTHQTREIVDQANQAMKKLMKSMKRMDQATEKSSRIIKRIDEIAFQTNLLALNAAVEAARAGQAGAGFAVVAEEVRSLALRAAEAAGDTARLMESNIQMIKEGSQLAQATDQAFDQVADSAGKMRGLMQEIAASSEEQSQGINQINLAAGQMDQLTQNVSVSAEQSAKASDELSRQAREMRKMVEKLTRIVGRSGDKKDAFAPRLGMSGQNQLEKSVSKSMETTAEVD
jgi:methyl-accepting chemotaxis protein